MILKRVLLLTILLLSAPVSAIAQYECASNLTQKDFFKEIKELNGEIQKNINEYRKLEASVPQQTKGSPEAVATEKRLTEIKSELEKQKATFKELNSQYFPTTAVTAMGAACQDRRWVEHAKELLINRPENLGKRYFVWLDKGTRELKASHDRPAKEVIAE